MPLHREDLEEAFQPLALLYKSSAGCILDFLSINVYHAIFLEVIASGASLTVRDKRCAYLLACRHFFWQKLYGVFEDEHKESKVLPVRMTSWWPSS